MMLRMVVPELRRPVRRTGSLWLMDVDKKILKFGEKCVVYLRLAWRNLIDGSFVD